ncbi:MAG TPA: pyridine nucleotide-disulfide oxidoreductase, partial [Clostridiales bacterium]|nr:pyridine nucleotide-disulfide oxidoreductase [Clostridiales bacterium]
YGGHVAIAHPKYANFVINRRITESENPYITYCINCRDAFLGAGKKTIHILDVIFGDRSAGGKASLPTITERRKNRIALKEQLLKDIWGEKTVKKEPQIQIDLKIDPELKAKLNREWILEEEVANVIEFCERTGRKVMLAEKGTFSGYRQIGRMTYWVEYRKDGENFELVNAYSHRMKIELEAVWDGRKVDIDL